ncbi:MAG: GTP-binding protein [Candidatus Njordarchaeia archaeon]
MRIPIDKIVSIMEKTDKIRNVGVLAHVDHGKSTLSDVILSESGYISKDLAGKLLYLDYLEEEQKRGITIKTAAISVLLKSDRTEYLLNLIDTPGHVDFSGKVVRALRLMDGAVVVVDAVEGIMAQTEAVIKQLIEERIKPILFINKVDRLIRELNYNQLQVQSRFEEIIISFNELVKSYADSDWEYYYVNPSTESVVFGSALYNWGFTVKTASEKNLKFLDIYNMVIEDPAAPRKVVPLGKVMSRLIYEKLPSPCEAQKFRVSMLWEGSPPPKEILECRKDKLSVMYISKLQKESSRLICTARVFSGIAKPGIYYDCSTNKVLKVNAVGILAGSGIKIVKSVPAGNVVGLVMSKAELGMTIASDKIGGCFKKPKYDFVPVMYIAITPIYPRDFDKLLEMLDEIKIEDPNIRHEINRDTGQVLVWGIGELQLELLVKRLKENLQVYTTEPLVSFKEIPVESISYQNDEYIIEIKPLQGAISEDADEISELENRITLDGIPKGEIENVEKIIQDLLKSGPLIGEPISGVEVKIRRIQQTREFDFNKLLNTFMEAYLKLKTEIGEPYYKFEIMTKTHFLGLVNNEITRRGGKIEKILGEKMDIVTIRGIIPVRTSLGLPTRIRELTSGNAYIQLLFHRYMVARDKAKEEIIETLKARKGLN